MTRPSLQLRMLTQLSVALVGIGLFSLQAHAQAVFRISAIHEGRVHTGDRLRRGR